MAEARGKRLRSSDSRMWSGPTAGLGLLLVLGAVYFLVTRPGPAPKAPDYLLHVTTNQISALEFHAKGKTLTLYANAGSAGAIDWTINRPGGTSADNTLVQSFVSSLVTLAPSRKLMDSPTPTDLQSFGLAPAGSMLLIHLNNSQPSIELDVGQTAPTGEYYTRVGGNPAVYLIDGMVAGEITADPNAWLPIPSSSVSGTGASGTAASAPSAAPAAGVSGSASGK